MNDQTTDREGLAEVLGAHVIARWSDHTYGCRSCANHYEQTADPFEMCEYAALSKPDWTYEQAMDHLADRLLASPQFARIIAEAEARALREAADELRRLDQIGKTQFHLIPDDDWEWFKAHPIRGNTPDKFTSAVLPPVHKWLTDRAALVAPDAGGEE